jgi:hypothetical protein
MQNVELEEVMFLESIKCGDESTGRIVTKEDEGAKWSATLQMGFVTIHHKKANSHVIVPIANVKYMVPKRTEELKAATKK